MVKFWLIKLCLFFCFDLALKFKVAIKYPELQKKNVAGKTLYTTVNRFITSNVNDNCLWKFQDFATRFLSKT